MKLDIGRIFIFVGGALLALVTGAAIFTPDLPLHLLTAVNATLFNSITSEFSWTPSSGTSTGERTLTLIATDTEGTTVTKNITVNVENAVVSENEDSDSGSNDAGGSGGGGSGGGDSSSEDSNPRSLVTKTYQAEVGHQIEGDYSGVFREGSGKIVKIAHGLAVLETTVSVPKDNYWLNVRVRHDKPGPVDFAVYLNNRAWKTMRLTRADNKYYTHQIGLLRDFSGGTIRFRLLNDTYDKNHPTNEDLDRNLFIDWWQLSTSKAIPKAPASAVSKASRSVGWSLLPGLNQYIREELGEQYVRVDVWVYYAWRLTVVSNHPANISSPSHLRNVMRYWKGVSPATPYGERLQ